MTRREWVLPSIAWVFATHHSNVAASRVEPERPPRLPEPRVEPSSPRAQGRYEPYLWAYALQTRPKQSYSVRHQHKLPSVNSTSDTSSEMTGNPSTIHGKRTSTDTQYTTFDAFANGELETGGADETVTATVGFWAIVKVFLVTLILNIRRILGCQYPDKVTSPC